MIRTPRDTDEKDKWLLSLRRYLRQSMWVHRLPPLKLTFVCSDDPVDARHDHPSPKPDQWFLALVVTYDSIEALVIAFIFACN